MANRAEALKNAIYRRLAFKYFSGESSDGLKDLLREESGSTEINAQSSDTEKEQVRISDIYDDGLAEVIAEEITGLLFTKSGISSDYTMDVSGDEPFATYFVANPASNTIDFTLPEASGVIDIPITVEVRYKGNGLIDRGDCESTTPPMITPETSAYTLNANWSRSSDQAQTGEHSYKFEAQTSSAWTIARFVDNDSTSDLHGISDETHTCYLWMYVPSVGGPDLDEVYMESRYYDGGAWTTEVRYPTVTDQWTRLVSTVTVPSTATSYQASVVMRNTITAGEFVFVDNVQLFQHRDVTVIGPIETQPQIVMSTEGELATFISDGNVFREPGALSRGKDAFIKYNAADGGSIDFVFNRTTT